MSEKGPDNQLELNGRTDELLSKYGNVDVARYGQGLKVALQYLTYSNSLYAIRVTPDHTNCAAMSNIYNNLYGKFQKSAIQMREAAYANIGIATNEAGEFEFIHVGPENLGTIIGITTLVPPTTPKLNDRYYIPNNRDAVGTWQGHEGELAICISENPVVWAYKEINDTSVAIINNVPMCAAVIYEQLPSLALWRPYQNVNPNKSGTYTTVLDIIDSVPTTVPVDREAYLICSNPSDDKLVGHEGQVLIYKEDMQEWFFEKYNKVFVEKDYIFTDEAPTSPSVGDRFVIGDTPTTLEWQGHEREIAVRTTTGWKYLKIDVAEPEQTDKFQSVVLDKYINATETVRMEYKRKNVFVKDVIWTSDINATFVAYAHRMIQFDDIVTRADPDSSIENKHIEPFIIFYPIGRGSYYNNMHIDMRLSKRSIHEPNDFNKVLIIDIYNTEGGNKLKVESYEVSFNPNHKDLSGNSMFIQDVINKYSSYVRVAMNREIFTDTALFTRNIHSDIQQLFQRYSIRNRHGSTSLPPKFQHGDDGTIFDKYDNLDWEQATSILVRAYTGQIVNPAALDQGNPYESDVLDREMRQFDLIFDAGYPGDVKVAIQTLIDARHQDCFGLIDLGDNASAKAAFQARTEEGGVGRPFNTPFIGIYEPYSLVYDSYAGRDVWITPVYHAARAYALTDTRYGKFHAPAGTKRGMCPEVKKLRYNLNREVAYQDLFVTYNINPIIQNRDGYVIWGQSTSQLRTSKYQDINVVRMVLQIKRDLERELRHFIFDLNDSMTWVLMSGAVNAYLGNLVSQNALEGFATQVYATSYDITRHRVRVDVMLDPKMVIYQILLTISV